METQKSLLTRGLWTTRKYIYSAKILQTNTTYFKMAGGWERTLQIRLNRLK